MTAVRNLVPWGHNKTLVALWIAMAAVAYSQTRPATSDTDVQRLLVQLEKEPFPLVVNQLADAHATEAIPILREKFASIRVTDLRQTYLNDEFAMKGAIASALVRLGVKDGPHWDFLVTQATIAVNSDAPWPIARDEKGNYAPKTLSLGFIAWAKARKVDPSTEAWNQMGMQNRLWHLATSGDARGLALLRKGLASTNYLVQAIAAKGLAILEDTESIPSIVEACSRTSTNMSADYATVIAAALVFFNDPQAKKAAEKFIRDPLVLESLQKKNRSFGPRGLFR